MMKSYYRFRGDLFKVNYNFEQSATLVSEADNEAIITGVFRTSGDFGALIWGSEDYIKNDYISYKTNYDYRNTKLTFKANFSGYIQPYSDLESEQSLTILNNDGTTNYVALGFCSSTSEGNASMNWTGSNGDLGKNWIKWGSIKATWSKDGKQGICIENQDFKVDYVKGIVSVCAGNKVPYLAEVNLTFEYSNFDNYIIDFNNLYTTLSPYTGVRLDTSNISEIRFPLIPKNYDKTGVMVANSTEEEYSVKFTEIEVVNGFLNDENPEIEATGYSIAEDYDSTYSYCPRRLAREMRKLGYSEIVDLYIGASHFYCKNGVTGTKITDYKDMTLDSSKGINIAFRSWLESYCKNLLLNNVSSLVISVSLENLEMPEVWRQKLWNGQDGETGWQPPTNFYSLTNPDVREYIRNVSNECLEIVGQSGLEKIFQFGEPWWWCQSFKGGDVSVSNPSSPLAIYDSYTQSKFESDNGYKMPIYSTSTFEMDEQSTKVANWLNEQLQDYSNFMKSIAKNNGALFTVLYYPPSTLSDNVPKFVKSVNTPFNAWNNNQLDYLELEDYEWVTGNSPQHQEVYTFGQDVLGYPTSKQQYFAGYVDNPGDAYEEWSLIFQAAEEAKEKGFANVFIWAGTQVREYNVIGIKAESNNTNQNNNITAACDTEYVVTLEEAQSLADAGYTVIGRTLNGDNPLSLNELENIMAAGLNVVPIYISNMNITKDVYENTQQGTLDAVNAATLATNLGFPITSTIYFTANYSNNQADLDYIVLPYFNGVKKQYTIDKTQYNIGIYGPRNTCLATEDAGYTTLSFVEDAVNIKSGNKGYNIPSNWAFNQIGASEINGLGFNEDISSGKDNGSNNILDGWICRNNEYYYYINGVKSTGWQIIDDVAFYFYPDGILARNTTIDGYELDSNGIIIYDSSNGFALIDDLGLKNTENFRPGALEHIFYGQEYTWGGISGYHYNGADGAIGKIASILGKLSNGVYDALISINGKERESTMFPDNLSEQEVVDMINAVAKDGKLVKNYKKTPKDINGNKYETTYNIKEGICKNIVIRVVIDTDEERGGIVTSYPTGKQKTDGLPIVNIDENKPDENKPDENKPDENKPDENKPDENKPDENKPNENKPDENKPDENKPDENKPDENKPDENKPDENKPDENEPDKPKIPNIPDIIEPDGPDIIE